MAIQAVMRRYRRGLASQERIIVASEELDGGVNPCHRELFQLTSRMEQESEAGVQDPPVDDDLDFPVYHALFMSFLCWWAVYASPTDTTAPDENTRIAHLERLVLNHTDGNRALPYRVVGLSHAPRCPAALVLHRRTLYVACRGSMKQNELIGDLSIASWAVDGVQGLRGTGCVHTGFLYAFREQAADVLQRVDKLVRDEDVEHVIFCGHSLGGALAQLLGVVYAQQRSSRRSRHVQMSKRVSSSVVFFGCSRLGDAAFRATLDALIDHTRLYVLRDPISALPFWYAPHGGTVIPQVGGWELAPARTAERRRPDQPTRALSTTHFHRLTTYATALKDHRSQLEGMAEFVREMGEVGVA